LASAWTLDPKKAQIIATTAFSKANVILDADGNPVDIQSFSKSDSRLYVEFGLAPSLMFVGQAAYQDIQFQGAGSDVNFSGFGETKLALQYRLKERNGLASSLMVGYVLDVEEGDAFKWVWFFDVQAGGRYDLKSDIVSRRQIDLTAGIKPNERWMLLTQIFALDIEEQISQGFDVPGLQQVKAELSIAYKIRESQYLQFGVLQTLAGRSVVREKGLFTGFWQSF